MGVRADIAAAVGQVPGVVGRDWPPPAPLAGDCWAQWAGIPEPDQYGDGDVDPGPVHWDVCLVLPALGADWATRTATDVAVPAVMRALGPLGAVGPATPRTMVLAEGRSVPVVLIRLTTEGT